MTESNCDATTAEENLTASMATTGTDFEPLTFRSCIRGKYRHVGSTGTDNGSKFCFGCLDSTAVLVKYVMNQRGSGSSLVG